MERTDGAAPASHYASLTEIGKHFPVLTQKPM